MTGSNVDRYMLLLAQEQRLALSVGDHEAELQANSDEMAKIAKAMTPAEQNELRKRLQHEAVKGIGGSLN